MTQDQLIGRTLKRMIGRHVGAAQFRFFLWWVCEHGEIMNRLPKRMHIEAQTGIPHNQILRTVRSLENKGLVETQYRPDGLYLRAKEN